MIFKKSRFQGVRGFLHTEAKSDFFLPFNPEQQRKVAYGRRQAGYF